MAATGKRMIVDTCLGNDKQGRGVPWWNNLQGRSCATSAPPAYPREFIDTVMCTHLHVDHVGWNTMLDGGQWVPTFPKARVPHGAHRVRALARQQARTAAAVFADSCSRCFDAGLVDLVEIDHKICDEVSFMPTLGHTPGHVSIRVQSKGEEALITGDFMHHPCQMAHPEWRSTADSDPEFGAAHPRAHAGRTVVEAGAGDGTGRGATAGHIVKDGDTYRMDV